MDVMKVLLRVGVPGRLRVAVVERWPWFRAGRRFADAGIDAQRPQLTCPTVEGGEARELLGIEVVRREGVVREVDLAVEFLLLPPLHAKDPLDT